MEVPKEMTEKVYKLVESVKVDGKLRKGTNETTKAVEKSEAQLVITAGDVSPKEIIMHLSVLCEEKSIPYVEIPSKSELGAAAGMPISTSSVAIVNPGDGKKQLITILKDLENLKKAEAKGSEPAPKVEEKPAEAPKEEKNEPKVEEAPKEEPKTDEKPTDSTEQSSAQPKEEPAKVEEKKEEASKTDEPKAESTEAPVEETKTEKTAEEKKPEEK
mgnify:FL=1